MLERNKLKSKSPGVFLVRYRRTNVLNPIRAGGGVIYDPPLVFFYPHFICVRARDLKFYDFLNNIKTNLVILFFLSKS